MWKYAKYLKQSVEDEKSHIHIPMSSAKIMGKEVKINSKGLRDREFDYSKNKNTYRILVLGDSLTFGFGADQEKTFPKILEKLLNSENKQKYEVINTGIGNYNTKQELAFFQKEGYKYNPDKVILAFYINDAENTQKYTQNFLTNNSINFAFLKSTFNKFITNLDKSKQFENYYSSLYFGNNWIKYEKTLTELTNIIDNKKLIVVILPELHILKPYPFSGIDIKIKEFFTKKGYQVINTIDSLNNAFPESLWVAKDDVHPNNKAHQIIGTYIFNQIKNELISE